MIRTQLAALSLALIFPLFSVSQEREKPPKAVGITLSLPWVNSYRYYNYDLLKATNKSGFVGLGGSVFYNYGDNKYSLNYGFTGDLPAPIGAIDYGKEGTRSNIGASFIEAIYHKSIYEKIKLIGGLNYLRYRYTFTSYVDTLPSYRKFDKTIGLTIGAEYLLRKNTALALFYRPAIIGPGLKGYRHMISLDARFDIRFWKKD